MAEGTKRTSGTTDLVIRLRAASKARELPAGISLMAIPTVWPGHLEAEAASEIERLRDEVEELKTSVIAFGGPAMAAHARERGLPFGHLHPVHYDILAKVGARMDDFTRAELTDHATI